MLEPFRSRFTDQLTQKILFTPSQIEAYFERIHYQDVFTWGVESLDRLCALHQQYIPYENVAIMEGTALDLSPSALFDKMICQKRGGFCFELNALFRTLLQSLGYSVTNLMARIHTNENNLPFRRHQVLAVHFPNEIRICDVGVYSDASRTSLVLDEAGVHFDGLNYFKLFRDEVLGWVLTCKRGEEDYTELSSFTLDPYQDYDFIQACYYAENHVDSTYNKFPLAAIRTTYGRICLKDTTLSISHKDELQRIELTKPERAFALDTYFGLTSKG